MQMTLTRHPAHIARRVVAFALTIAACLLMIVSADSFRPTPIDRALIPQAMMAFLLGGVALGAALLVAREPADTLRPAATPLIGRARWLLLVAGIVILALVGEISGGRFAIPWLMGLSFDVQFALLAAGILLVGFGLGGLYRWAAIEWRNVAAIAAIMAIGLGVRLWQIETSLRFMMDESVFTDAMLDMLFTPGLLNGGGKSTFTQIYPYWNTATVALFGNNFFALRLPSVLIGLMTIPAIYGLSRSLFDNRLALVAALIAATFPPNVHFSRISWGHMGNQLFGILTLMFIARGLAHNRRLDWSFAGVSLGLTQYFYEVGRLLYPPLVVIWGGLLALGWNLRSHRRGLLIMGVAALLIAAPVYYSVAVRGMPFTPRFNESGRGLSAWAAMLEGGLSDFEQQEIILQWSKPFLVYTHFPDIFAEYYGGYQGFVPPPLIPLFLLGVAWLIWRARYPSFVLLLSLGLVSAANIFANESAIGARYVAMLGVLPIIIAVGLRAVLRLLSLDKWKSIWVAGAVLIAVFQVYFYFGVHLPYFNEQRRRMIPERDLFDAMLLTPELPYDTEVYLLDRMEVLDYGRAARLRDYLAGFPRTQPKYGLQAPLLSAFDPAALPRDRNYAFFVTPGDNITLRKILEAFPDIQPPRYSLYPIPAWDEYILLFWSMR